ncbi:MAG: cysteine desulfurase family protein [Thermodesulfobacteriota bacterium]|nr:cysteine desulfurase family protein [Thermodesulfobacteriota bacterium]
MNIINLDRISSNPLLPEVQEAMIEAIKANYGNPSSQHKMGDAAGEVLEKARTSVATLIQAKNPREVVFTSGGTESVNHAIKGIAFAHRDKGKHIVTSNIEHNSVIRSLRALKMLGYQVTSLPVDHHGLVDPENVLKAVKKDTILISIIHGNNEIGTIQPIEEIAEIAKEKKILFHVDAVDSVGVVPVDVQKSRVDLLSFASNPYYGPTGIGGLYIRSGIKIWPLLDGGTQEFNKRAGAENLIGIMGMGVAADLAHRQMNTRVNKLRKLREKLVGELPNYIDEYIINGHPESVLPNLLSVSIKYIEGESVVLMLDDDNIAVSTRSACASGSLRASHVLLSTGLEFADAQGTLVITFGVDNTEDDLMTFLNALKKTVTTLRSMSPLYKRVPEVT